MQLPHNWTPRPYQMGVWRYLAEGGRHALDCWHRRGGKDEVGLHHTACAAHERVGNYWYLLPQYNQARKSMWDAVNPHTGLRRIDEAFPGELRARYLEDEMKIVFHCGSTFQLVGSDNFNSLVGSPPIGLVFSEYALSDPASRGYLRPIILENNGWELINSTPRGNNHFKALKKYADEHCIRRSDGSVDPSGWYSDVVTVDDSGIFTDEQMAAELAELQAEHGDEYGMALWLQEYFCSFDAAIPGSIFGPQIERMRRQGRLGAVPLEESQPVHTGWDLGRTDDTAIWWFQVFAGEVRVLDYHSSSLKDIDFYVEKLQEKKAERGFRYGTHYLPHDARPRTLAAGGKSILQQFNDWNAKTRSDGTAGLDGALGTFAIAPRLDKQEQIQAARKTLGVTWMDETRCEMGLECLINYQREWDQENRCFKPAPLHNWASHGADGWQTLSVAWRRGLVPKPQESSVIVPGTLVSGTIRARTFGDLKKAHLRKMRAARLGLE